MGIEPTSELGKVQCVDAGCKPKIDRLDSNKKLKKSTCFIQCRLGTRKPFFLSLSCTEFVPNSVPCRFPPFYWTVSASVVVCDMDPDTPVSVRV